MIHSNNWPNWWNTINTKIRFHKTSSARMRIEFCAWDFFVIMYFSKQHKEGFMTKFSPWLYCHFCKYLSSELYFLDLQSLVDGCFLDFSLSSLTTCLAFAAELPLFRLVVPFDFYRSCFWTSPPDLLVHPALSPEASFQFWKIIILTHHLVGWVFSIFFLLLNTNWAFAQNENASSHHLSRLSTFSDSSPGTWESFLG